MSNLADRRVLPPADFDKQSAHSLQNWLRRIATLEGTRGLWRIWTEAWPGNDRQRLHLWGQWSAAFAWASDRERRELETKLRDASQKRREATQAERAAAKAKKAAAAA